MRTNSILLNAILTTTILVSTSCSYKSDAMTNNNARTSEYLTDDNYSYLYDGRNVAENFVMQINYARIELGKQNGKEAKKHILEARNLISQMKDITGEERVVQGVESGRIAYEYDFEPIYYYFPIETGPMRVKKLGHGPIWAKNDLAVTDANIVYLTVDLRGDKPSMYLTDAENQIELGNLKAADKQLAKLTDEVVKVDEKTSAPVTKAHDNITLAHNFISVRNFKGARYALKHAGNALEEMQKDSSYKDHHTEIVKMNKDLKSLQSVLTRKDPNMAEKATVKLDKWLVQLNNWSDKQ